MREVGGPLAQNEATGASRTCRRGACWHGESIQPELDCRITAVWHARTTMRYMHLAPGSLRSAVDLLTDRPTGKEVGNILETRPRDDARQSRIRKGIRGREP